MNEETPEYGIERRVSRKLEKLDDRIYDSDYEGSILTEAYEDRHRIDDSPIREIAAQTL